MTLRVSVASQAGLWEMMGIMATCAVTLVDDLDGSNAADETVRFAIDGTEYEIHLTSVHAAEFRSVFNIYIGAARRSSRLGPEAG